MSCVMESILCFIVGQVDERIAGFENQSGVYLVHIAQDLSVVTRICAFGEIRVENASQIGNYAGRAAFFTARTFFGIDDVLFRFPQKVVVDLVQPPQSSTEVCVSTSLRLPPNFRLLVYIPSSCSESTCPLQVNYMNDSETEARFFSGSESFNLTDQKSSVNEKMLINTSTSLNIRVTITNEFDGTFKNTSMTTGDSGEL